LIFGDRFRDALVVENALGVSRIAVGSPTLLSRTQ